MTYRRTSDGLSFVACDVEIRQLEADTWLSLSGFSTSVAVSGGDRQAGEVNVHNDERPIVRAGKLASQDVTLKFVYTEEGGADVLAETGWDNVNGPWQAIRLWNEAVGGNMCIRYFPKGKEVGNYFLDTGQGFITSFLDPGGEAGSGDPILGEVTVKSEHLEKEPWVSDS